MNKPTNANLSKFYNMHRHTIATYKKERFRVYQALKEYFVKVHKNEA